MARIQGEAPVPENEGEGLESGTPKSATEVPGSLFASGKKDGLHLAAPRAQVVDEYPERPFASAKAK